MKTSICASLLALSLLGLAGCDQIENSTKQVVGAAANSARQVIDDTHKAATEALDDAKNQLSTLEPEQKDKQEDKAGKSGQEI
ncbi:hypothetical protein [Pseudomonas huanghezhanensis]|uniref:hypothetical protein n=1 Tax=Pseudomonas huanghezhanensis TaxID=3002903 RepID=UPI002285C2E8|nr:hypothetical protein [Pseudomonas sp. BSw22131]